MAFRNGFDVILDMQENLTGYAGVIDSDHAYIHKGIGYSAVINTGAIAAAYRIAIKTPTVVSGKFLHWRPSFLTSNAAYVEYTMTEGETYTSGTDVTPFCRNRPVAGTSTVQELKKNVTSTPAGIVIQSLGAGTAGVGPGASGGGVSGALEIVLASNTTYIITLTPSASTTVILTLFWYEEDGYTGA